MMREGITTRSKRPRNAVVRFVSAMQATTRESKVHLTGAWRPIARALPRRRTHPRHHRLPRHHHPRRPRLCTPHHQPRFRQRLKGREAPAARVFEGLQEGEVRRWVGALTLSATSAVSK